MGREFYQEVIPQAYNSTSKLLTKWITYEKEDEGRTRFSIYKKVLFKVVGITDVEPYINYSKLEDIQTEVESEVDIPLGFIKQTTNHEYLNTIYDSIIKGGETSADQIKLIINKVISNNLKIAYLPSIQDYIEQIIKKNREIITINLQKIKLEEQIQALKDELIIKEALKNDLKEKEKEKEIIISELNLSKEKQMQKQIQKDSTKVSKGNGGGMRGGGKDIISLDYCFDF